LTSTVVITAERIGGPVGGLTVVRSLAGGEPWRARLLRGGGAFARAVLVQSRAGLLAGDDVCLQVSVGPGASLELSELGACLVHDVRGLSSARVRVRTSVQVGAGGRLIWLSAPVILCDGALLDRSVSVECAVGGVLVLGESVVLGRAGERGDSQCLLRLSVAHGGKPLLDETLDTSRGSVVRSPVVAGGAKVLAGCLLAGARCDPAAISSCGIAAMMQLHGPGSVWRGVGEAVELAREASVVGEAFADVVRRMDSPEADSLLPLGAVLRSINDGCTGDRVGAAGPGVGSGAGRLSRVSGGQSDVAAGAGALRARK
jgi:urease accessory protein